MVQMSPNVRVLAGGNIEQWVLSYFFDGAESTSELTDHESVEVQERECGRDRGRDRKGP